MPKPRPNIAAAMRDAAGSTRSSVQAFPAPNPVATPEPTAETAKPVVQPSRQGTKAITGHYPPPVRYQLKLLAAEQGRTMEDMLAEGINMLFATYGKPEIAPASRKRPSG